MIEKKTFINQITMDRTGVVLVQFVKCVVEDGEVISQEYHRTSIEPGVDPDEQLAAVDAHLPAIKAAPVTDEPTVSVLKRADIKAVCQAAHTPAVVAKFKANKQAQIDRG